MGSWITRASRLHITIGRFKSDPYLRGRASQTLAAALLADGLVGLDNPLAAGRDRRSGVFGAFGIAAIGLLFILLISPVLHADDAYSMGKSVDGVLISITHDDEDGTVCTGTVRYLVANHTYDVALGSASSTLCSKEGTHVPVSYLPSEPGGGRPQIAEINTVENLILIVGWVVFVVGSLTALVRITEIVAGIVLFVRGGRLVKTSTPVPAAHVVEDLRTAWNG